MLTRQEPFGRTCAILMLPFNRFLMEARRWQKSAIIFSSLLMTAGCKTLGDIDTEPDPLVQPPDTFPASLQHDMNFGMVFSPDERNWWESFGDDQLSKLISQSLASNFTTVEFANRVLAARAVARQEGAALLPSLDGFATGEVRSFNENSITDSLNRNNMDFFGNVGGIVSWEPDLFGRLRSREEAALADVEASLDDWKAVRLMVAADVADSYYGAVEQLQLLELLNSQIERDRTLLELVELRFANGDATGLDLLRQRAQLAEAEALVPGARAELRRRENTLDALLGQAADGVNLVDATFPTLNDNYTVGVPSQLLVRRPDLRAAQNRLIAADFRIAEAVADRFPRFNLTGSLVYNDAPDASGFASSLLAGVTAPLWDWGRRAEVVQERRMEYNALLADYANTFVNAISEVDSLLFAEMRQREQVDILTSRIDNLDRAVVEARNRYVNGVGNYTDVLIALDDLQETQRDLIAARGALVRLRVSVFRAIGGGIDEPEDPVEQNAQLASMENRS